MMPKADSTTPKRPCHPCAHEVPMPDSPADPAPPPKPPPTAAMAIGFATPAISMLLAMLVEIIARSAGFAINGVFVLCGALVTWMICLLFAMEGIGYACRCALRWPY